MRKSIALAVAVCTASLFISPAANATTGTWIGPTNSVWSDTANWQDAIVPNGQGDTALFDNTTIASRVAKNDVNGPTTISGVTGVTVGTLKVSGTNAASSMQFTPNQNIVLDADGAGPLRAQFINDVQLVNPGVNTNAALFLNAHDTSPAGLTGNFWLNDDLFISNTSNTTRTTGSIQIRGTINGNGNLYIENVSNNIAAGQIAFSNNESGAGLGFGGDVFINKGAVTMSRGDVFTPGNKNVRLGTAGLGDVTLAFTGGALGGVEYNFISEPNNGFTNLFVANATSADPNPENRNVVLRSTFTNVGNVILNGPMTFENRVGTGSTLVIGDRISGVSGFTKIGVGPMRLTNTNSYSGGTTVNAGTLVVAHTDAIDSIFGHHDPSNGTLGTSTVTINSGNAALPTPLTPTKLQIDTLVASVNVIANTATLVLAGGGFLDTPDDGVVDLGAGVNEVVGGLILGGVAQTAYGTYGATGSGATFINNEYFTGPGTITLSADFNVDGLVDSSDYVTWRKANGDIGAYNNWRANFGNTVAGAGVGSGLGNQAVPEPRTLLLAMTGVLLAWAGQRRR